MKIKLIAALVAATAMASTSAANAEVKVSTKGGLKVESGDYKFEFGGRIMYDFNKSELNGVTDENDFDLRRGRVYAKGNIAKNWSFKSQFNIDGSGVEDLYLRYSGFGKGAVITIGNQKMPFGLEQMTSSKDISILERAASTERFDVGRGEGIQLSGVSGNSTYAFGVYTDDEKDADIGFASRVTTAFKGENSLFHVGLGYRDINEDSGFGVELAAVTGPFHVQAEYFDAEEGADDDLSGYYVQAGYFLTGESRPYKKGVFKRAAPKAKSGAWEVVARYEDGDGNHSDIELGSTDASAYTLGLNWYAHKNVKFGVNYTDGEDNLSDDDGSEFRVRFQLTF